MTEIPGSMLAAGATVDRAAGGAAQTPRSDRPVASGPGFADRLIDAVKEADRSHHVAEDRARELARGEGDVVQTMVALSKADLSLRLAVNIRNRALEAYQEIMRLPI
ncbi:MAG: flagellar hook-basal body complex protein FliE [Myxococcota bacterium]